MELSNQIIQSFWDGPITTMERLCVSSFLKNGHQFTLYTYQVEDALSKMPKGTFVLDANQIVPKDMMNIFPTKQQFADYFRVVLSEKFGGWYVDMDTVCMRPFNFKELYVLVQSSRRSILMTSPMKVPAHSELMQRWLKEIGDPRFLRFEKLNFQEIGPIMLGKLVPELHLEKYVLPRSLFDPVGWINASKVVDPGYKFNHLNAYAVHLFHAIWNNGPQAGDHPLSPDTEGTYPPACLYEKLKRKYLTEG